MGFHLQHMTVHGLLALAAPSLPPAGDSDTPELRVGLCRVGTRAGCPIPDPPWAPSCGWRLSPAFGMLLWHPPPAQTGTAVPALCDSHSVPWQPQLCLLPRTDHLHLGLGGPPCAHLPVPTASRARAHTESGGNSLICSAEMRSGAQTWLRYSQELLEWQMERNSWIK